MRVKNSPVMGTISSPNSHKFNNKFLLMRLSTSNPKTISFDDQHHSRYQYLLSPKQKSRIVKKPLTAREYTHKKRQSFNRSDDESQQVRRISFSRMIEESSKREDFNLRQISQFFKRPLSREAVKKTDRRQKGKFSEILHVVEYNPQEAIAKNRLRRVAESRCRCHKNPQNIKPRNVKTSQMHRQRVSQFRNRCEIESPQAAKSDKKQAKPGRRRTIALNMQQNWKIQSWQNVNAKISDREDDLREEVYG